MLHPGKQDYKGNSFSPRQQHPFSLWSASQFIVPVQVEIWHVASQKVALCMAFHLCSWGKAHAVCASMHRISLSLATTLPYVSRLLPGIFSKEYLHPKTMWAEKANFNHSEWHQFFVQIKMTVNDPQGSESPLPVLTYIC